MSSTLDSLHLRWSDRPTDRPIDLLERKRVIGQQAMVSRVFLKKGCDIPTHAHVNEQIAMVMSGKVRFGIGAEGSNDRREVIVGAEEVMYLPSNLPHSCYAIEDTLIFDIFSPPSQMTGIDRSALPSTETRAH
jgi:quercetin dioxygenase-like cupin family protein